MSKVFRAKFVVELRKEVPDLPQSQYDALFKKKWVVFAKRAFKNTESVIEYLGRYTHKIAISNYRIRNIDYEKHTTQKQKKLRSQKTREPCFTNAPAARKEYWKLYSFLINVDLQKGTRTRTTNVLLCYESTKNKNC